MFSTELSTAVVVLCISTLCFCVAITAWIMKISRYCHEVMDWVQVHNAKSLSLSRIAELEASHTELLDAHHATAESLRKLRARITMRQNREKRANGAESDTGPPPADEGERSRYKKQLRDAARKQGHRNL